MARSIIVVETGSSTASAARPNAPPIAPEVQASPEWSLRPPVKRRFRRLNSATSSARSRACFAILATAVEAAAGNARCTSPTGFPASAASRPARLGFSSRRTAAASASLILQCERSDAL